MSTTPNLPPLALLSAGAAPSTRLIPQGKPGVGRIVHLYVSDFDGPVAAIITALAGTEGAAHLTAFFPAQLPGYVSGPVPHAPTPTAGCWSWPPRN